MKKILVALAVAGVLSFGVSAIAVAQDAAIVKIPFQFIAGGQLLPAGTYRISAGTADWTVLSITNLDQKASAAIVVSEGLSGTERADSAKVKFMAYHGQYFLSEVAVPGRDVRRVGMTEAVAERTLAKLNLSTAQPANVAK